MIEPRIRPDILIIGESGRLASALVRSSENSASGLKVISLGRDSGMDITNRTATRQIIRTIKPKVIINTAAVTSVDKVEERLCRAIALNSLGAGVIAQCCREHDIKLIHISTDYVYDGRKCVPYSEEDSENPLNMYGRSKYIGDQIVRSILPDAAIVRTAWLFDADDGSFFSTVLTHISRTKEAKGATDQIGSPTYLPSLADALLIYAKALLDGHEVPTLLHLAGRGEATRFDVVSYIAEVYSSITGEKVRVKKAVLSDWETTTQRPLDTRLNCALASSLDLGLELQAWKVGIEHAVQTWIQEHGVENQK